MGDRGVRGEAGVSVYSCHQFGDQWRANRWASEGSCIVVVADLHQSVFQTGRDFLWNICFSFSKIPGARRGHASGPFVSMSRAGRIQFRHAA